MKQKQSATGIALIFFGLAFVLSTAYAEVSHDYDFFRDTNFTETSPIPWAFPPLEVKSYKELRSVEICNMAKAEGFTDKDCSLIIAHAITECGSMDEYCAWTEGSYRSDSGLAIGLFQFHLCYRYSYWMKENKFGCPHGIPKKAAVIRDKFFKDHPEMTTWRGQVSKYLKEQKECTKNQSLLSCVDRWNSHPNYVSKVKSNIKVAKSLLYDL